MNKNRPSKTKVAADDDSTHVEHLQVKDKRKSSPKKKHNASNDDMEKSSNNDFKRCQSMVTLNAEQCT